MLGPIIVDKSPPDNSEFSGPPTREGSFEFASLLNVRHSEPTSITLLDRMLMVDHKIKIWIRKFAIEISSPVADNQAALTANHITSAIIFDQRLQHHV